MRAPCLVLVSAAVCLAAACSEPAAVKQLHPTISFEPSVLDFGAVAPNSSPTKTFKITADGDGAVTFKGLKLSNDQRQAFTASGLPEKILPGASAEITVTYAAANDEATDAAAVLVTSDAENAPTASVSLVARTKAAACDDKAKDGTETDVDCGGSCGGCGAGSPCNSAADCDGRYACIQGHCGTCSKSADCAAGQICDAGVCTGCTKDAQCAAGQTCSNGQCTSCPGASTPIDTQTDPQHCGTCDHACPTPVHASATCVAGKCGRAACQPGFYDIDGDTTAGCESTCSGKTCTDGTNSWTFTAPPLAETGAVFQGVAAGSSFGAQVQTNAKYTNVGVAGENTPPPVGGATEQKNGAWRHQGGLNALQHAASQFRE